MPLDCAERASPWAFWKPSPSHRGLRRCHGLHREACRFNRVRQKRGEPLVHRHGGLVKQLCLFKRNSAPRSDRGGSGE